MIIPEKNGLGKRERPQAVAWITGGILAGMYAWLSVQRHWHFESGLHDLGTYVQGLWRLSRFERPESTVLRIPNLLADHFEPALLVLAPLFRIWPQPELLLVVQAIAVGLSVIPLHSFCRRRLEPFESAALAGAYGIYWGVQIAVVYDFHGIILALPALALALNAYDLGRGRQLALWLTVLLFLREDMGLLVAAFGVACWFRGDRRLGITAAVLGLFWTWVCVSWIMPSLGGSPGYLHWMYSDLGTGPAEAVGHLLVHPWQMLVLFMDDPVKRRTLFTLFVPFLGLSFFSPYVLLSLPLLAARFWSDNAAVWSTGFHYNALVAPILAGAAADGIRKAGIRMGPWTRRWSVMIVVLILAQALARLPGLPLRAFGSVGLYGLNSVSLEVREFLSDLPPEASVVVQEKLGAHVADRAQIRVLGPSCPDADLVLAWQILSPEPFDDFSQIKACLESKLRDGYKKLPAPYGLWVLSRR